MTIVYSISFQQPRRQCMGSALFSHSRSFLLGPMRERQRNAKRGRVGLLAPRSSYSSLVLSHCALRATEKNVKIKNQNKKTKSSKGSRKRDNGGEKTRERERTRRGASLSPSRAGGRVGAPAERGWWSARS